MNIKELKESKELFVLAKDVAPILHCKEQSIRDQAQKNPSALGFPVCVVGVSVKIPRKPFIKFWEGE